MTQQPPRLRPPGTQQDHKPAVNLKPYLLWLAVVTLLALALAVVFYLPRVSVIDTPGAVSPDMSLLEREPTATTATEATAAGANAEAKLREFLRLRARLELANTPVWGQPEWNRAVAGIEQADRLFLQNDFAAASMAYQRGIDLLHEIDTSRSARLAEALAQGQRALADNDVKSAMTRFEYALAIEPDNQQATLGLTRAQARGNVLDLMQDAWEAEQQGDLASALAAYEQANVLDGDFAQAAESVQRVAARINKERFHTAMSEAVGALDARQFKTAQKALAIAAQLQPDDASVQDLRQRLQRARKRSAIASLRKQAQQQIAAEDWQAASRSYKKALTIDPAVAFALDGKRLAHERIRLHQQLDHYLSEPTRLYSAEPLANAEQLLAAVDKVPENEPSLASKIATLRRHVAEAQTPVTIELHSDGLTDVVIYHVGRPGRFMQQQIELRPGTYILLGSRPGYRDVRKQIEVRPQMVPKVVRIRCEEMI